MQQNGKFLTKTHTIFYIPKELIAYLKQSLIALGVPEAYRRLPVLPEWE